MKLPEAAQLIEVGVDWITLTAKDHENMDRLRRRGEDVLNECLKAGDEVSVFRWKGYEGWTSGSCEVAVRDDSALVRLHGITANEEWWDCAQEAQNCTRIDFQLTYRLHVETVDHFLARAWRAVQRTKLHGKPVEWHYRRDRKKGNTLEFGRRPSEQFGRAYDKGKETKLDHYQGCARLETEYKGDMAWSMMKRLSGKHSQRDVIASNVRRFFELRGVVCVLPANIESRIDETVEKRHRVDKYLEWLQTSVRPGVARAIEKRGLDATLSALGLSKELLEKRARALEP